MPELPEVESAVRRLRPAVRGRVIRDIHLLHPAMQRTLPGERAALLRGDRIVDVERRGKHQLFPLASGRVLHVHFRMSGDWEHLAPGAPLPRFARAVLDLDDDTRIALVDSRALATIALHEADEDAVPELGPEPGDPHFGAAALRDALAHRRAAIKPVLLDQRVVAGLGNIYAAEALWRAGIDPRIPARALGPVRLERLVAAIRDVIARAQRGTGRYADGGGGRFRVYDREGQRCPRCGATIRRIVQAGRSTYYCPRCQKR